MSDEQNPFLAFSPMCSIKSSSEPFRAFLGATLSAIEGISVEPSIFNPHMKLDTVIEEDKVQGLSHKDAYYEGNEFGLMVCLFPSPFLQSPTHLSR